MNYISTVDICIPTGELFSTFNALTYSQIYYYIDREIWEFPLCFLAVNKLKFQTHTLTFRCHLGLILVVEIFIPTITFRSLKNVQKSFPNADFFLGDFNFLPGSSNFYDDAVTLNRPLISQKLEEAHKKKDYEHVLDINPGEADIFFQTNFKFLNFMFNSIFKREVTF